jgi:hypothetical protein
MEMFTFKLKPVESGAERRMFRLASASEKRFISMHSIEMKRFSDALAKRNIRLSAPDSTGYNLKVNISMNRMNAQEIAGSFMEAMKEVG